MWPMLVMAGLGALQGHAKQQQQEKWNRGQADVTRYSPWTGIKGDLKPVTDSALGGAMQGGLTGAMMSQSMGADKATPTDVNNVASSAAGKSYLGGDQMAQQLGAQGQTAVAGMTPAGPGLGNFKFDDFKMPAVGARKIAYNGWFDKESM